MLFGVTTVGDVHHPLRPCFQGSLGRGQFFSVARVVQHFGLLQQRGAGQVYLHRNQQQLRRSLKQFSCHHGFRRDIGQPRDRQEDEGHQRLHAQRHGHGQPKSKRCYSTTSNRHEFSSLKKAHFYKSNNSKILKYKL